ncbi:SusC/RagA family TonB-linked outer membrane protein [Mesoflavibacter zeaxanthinifaciens]|uniref:SusC/RagA family TonB-linked outer membrane protein n=1 Tax=Mesoflavibacter zeaxanthinifaciens TaxID=393060 RepID=UPI003A8F56BF
MFRQGNIFVYSLLFFNFYYSVLFAQDQEVSGQITDGQVPISGATIRIKHQARGTVSNFDGYYKLYTLPTDTLEVSFIGYKAVEVAIGGLTTIDVVLKENAMALGEVTINAGYYTVKNKERTGSISQIKAEAIEKQPISNPLAAMQGRMSGVYITQTTGVPGGGFDIQIRGRNSLRSEANTPLYIVDGVPFGTENLGSTSISAGILTGYGISPLNSLNPSDIERIEVLKDADATAIYGSRGANGVVLITTKRGQSGKTHFNIKSYSGVGEVGRKLELMNTEQYLDMREQAFMNDGLTEFPFYAYDVNGTWDRHRYTDWQDVLIGGTAYSNNLQATISGGVASTQFLLSGTRYKETTVFPGDFSFRKNSVHASLQHQSLDDRFDVSFTGSYVSDKNNLLATDLTRQAYTLAPNAPEPYHSDGTLNWENSTWNNPYRLLEETYLATTNNLISNIMLRYRPIKGLDFKLGIGYTSTQLQETKASPHTVYDPSYGLGSEASSLMVNDAKLHSLNVEPQVSYKRALFRGDLDIILGATFQSKERKQLGLYGWGFSNNSLIHNIAAASNVAITGTNNTDYKYSAVFGRLNYAISDRYFINLTGRRDGSSRFGPGKQFANFGAIGAAWLFSESNFIKNTAKWLSFGKLRGSLGTTGNDQIGDYQFLNTYSLSGLSYEGNNGLEPTHLYNPNFSWETNKKIEGAIELGFFKERLYLSTAYYHNRSSNQLVGVPLPRTTGFSSIIANLDAVVQNTGWEFELEGKLINREAVCWTVSVNLTVPKNKLISFPNLEGSTYSNMFVIGSPLDIRKVYHYIGMNPETGVYEFEDFDNDGQLTSSNDRQKIVSTAPTFYGGFQNHLTYKNLQLDFLFQFTKQQGKNNHYFGVLPGVASNLPVDFIDAWEAPSDSSSLQPYTTGLNANITSAYNKFTSSDAAFSDASFVRLKTLSLSYRLPKLWSLFVNSRVYIQGQNLLTFTKFNGPDPENQSVMLPPLRILSLGVDLNF